MTHDDPRGAAGGSRPDPTSPRHAHDEGAPGTPERRTGGRLRLAATTGGEIVISVLVALAFFAIFTLAMSVLMPSGLTLNEVVKPGSAEGAGDRNFTASLQDLGNLGDRLNPAAAVLTVLNTTVMRKAVDGIAWGQAPSGTPLQEGDAVQTTRDGTAMLTFSRGKHLTLEQNSLMIVRSANDADPVAIPTPSVHVLVGELWGNVAREGSDAAGMRVTSPGAETRVTAPSDAAAAQFRIAVARNKTSVLSVYRGSAEVVAQGRTVRVAANQFVAVDSLHGPGTPAELPGSPALVAPDGGATFTYRELAPQVEFRWNPVPGVDGYRLLVSRSPEFEGVVIDQRLHATSFTYGDFKTGPYYWRVSALRAGAEGAPSIPRAVVLSNVQRVPTLAVTFPADVVQGNQCTIRGVTDPGIRIVVAGDKTVTDAAGHFEHTVTLKRGFNVVVVEAIDRVGNTAYKSKVVEAKF